MPRRTVGKARRRSKVGSNAARRDTPPADSWTNSTVRTPGSQQRQKPGAGLLTSRVRGKGGARREASSSRTPQDRYAVSRASSVSEKPGKPLKYPRCTVPCRDGCVAGRKAEATRRVETDEGTPPGARAGDKPRRLLKYWPSVGFLARLFVCQAATEGADSRSVTQLATPPARTWRHLRPQSGGPRRFPGEALVWHGAAEGADWWSVTEVATPLARRRRHPTSAFRWPTAGLSCVQSDLPETPARVLSGSRHRRPTGGIQSAGVPRGTIPLTEPTVTGHSSRTRLIWHLGQRLDRGGTAAGRPPGGWQPAPGWRQDRKARLRRQS